MPITALGIQLLGLAHTISFLEGPRLPIDVEFGLQRGHKRGSPEESNYISQLRRRLRFAHKKAKHMVKSNRLNTGSCKT